MMKLQVPLLLAVVFSLGCGQETASVPSSTSDPATGSDSAPVTKTSNEQADAPAEPAAPKQREVTLEMVDVKGIHAAVAANKGKVVVMDGWATWCGPCLEEFPNLIAIHKKYGPEKVACISLSFDDVPDKANVLKFLKEQNAQFQNLQSKVDPDLLFTEFKIPALPAVLVYGKDGKLVKMADGHGAYKVVLPLVEKLVADEKSADSGE